MRLTVKLFAGFQKDRFAIRELETEPGTLVQGILDQFEIPAAKVGVLMVNGRHVDVARTLEAGDVLAIFPVIGGG
jgi:molybdopterin converting factor small subunit